MCSLVLPAQAGVGFVHEENGQPHEESRLRTTGGVELTAPYGLEAISRAGGFARRPSSGAALEGGALAV